MAVWQFVFDLIPAKSARIDGVVAAQMSREQLDGIELDFSPPTAEALFGRVCMLLPEKKSWSQDLRIWGDEESDDVQIFVRGGVIENVQFRMDLRDLDLSLVEGSCKLARDFDCVLSARSGVIIRPYAEVLLRTIMLSDAARYVKDPERYLLEFAQYDSKHGKNSDV